MPMYGDLSWFKKAQRSIEELTRLPSKVTGPIAIRINARLRFMFLSQTDPYGNPWASLSPVTVAKKGHSRILYENGDLMAGTICVPLPGAGLKILIGPKGYYHQIGRSNMPARKVFPDKGMPPLWRQDIDAEVKAAMITIRGK